MTLFLMQRLFCPIIFSVIDLYQIYFLVTEATLVKEGLWGYQRQQGFLGAALWVKHFHIGYQQFAVGKGTRLIEYL
jgi:hypothetical protein